MPLIPSELLHIYGPFSIQTYGLFIVIGLLVFMFFVKRDERFKALAIDGIFTQLVAFGAAIGLLGGRFLFLLSEGSNWCWSDMCSFWNGGFSMLGGVIALAIFMPLYLWYRGIPVLKFIDLISIYAPLLLGICRIGCFFAGCCYGNPTTAWWAVTYTDQTCCAPLFIGLHPTQLYSAFVLFMIFLLFYFWLRFICKKPGQLFTMYLFFQGLERFAVDFWRADRIATLVIPVLSLYQLIALGMMIVSFIGFIGASAYQSRTSV